MGTETWGCFKVMSIRADLTVYLLECRNALRFSAIIFLLTSVTFNLNCTLGCNRPGLATEACCCHGLAAAYSNTHIRYRYMYLEEWITIVNIHSFDQCVLRSFYLTPFPQYSRAFRARIASFSSFVL